MECGPDCFDFNSVTSKPSTKVGISLYLAIVRSLFDSRLQMCLFSPLINFNNDIRFHCGQTRLQFAAPLWLDPNYVINGVCVCVVYHLCNEFIVGFKVIASLADQKASAL